MSSKQLGRRRSGRLSGEAQFEEGRTLLCKGPASHPRAVGLLRAAAHAGHAVATAWLANTIWHGQGVQKDEAEAQRLARVALDERGLQALADQGDAAAQYSLGAMHGDGLGFAQDRCEAVAWNRKAAAQQHMDAQFALGCVYSNRYAYHKDAGVVKDDCEAVVWWRKAAEQGSSTAQVALGEGYYYGKGVQQDRRQSVVWWRKASEQGHAEGQYLLGCACSDGEGLDGVLQKDAAVALFKQAAEQDHMQAQCHLALAYQTGGEGVDRDVGRALFWFERSAALGDRFAQSALGDAYRDGTGVTVDLVQAVSWWEKGAAQGEAFAQCALADAYASAEGGKTKDLTESVKW